MSVDAISRNPGGDMCLNTVTCSLWVGEKGSLVQFIYSSILFTNDEKAELEIDSLTGVV